MSEKYYRRFVIVVFRVMLADGIAFVNVYISDQTRTNTFWMDFNMT